MILGIEPGTFTNYRAVRTGVAREAAAPPVFQNSILAPYLALPIFLRSINDGLSTKLDLRTALNYSEKNNYHIRGNRTPAFYLFSRVSRWREVFKFDQSGVLIEHF